MKKLFRIVIRQALLAAVVAQAAACTQVEPNASAQMMNYAYIPPQQTLQASVIIDQGIEP
jgi:hypothetical protein